jgi:AraC-like DNA-binding protein
MQSQQLDFSSLLDQARRDAALHAVANTRQALTDIGQSLGFAEPSTFWRAFKRWTGQTPAQWRLHSAVIANSASSATPDPLSKIR